MTFLAILLTGVIVYGGIAWAIVAVTRRIQRRRRHGS